jgi:replicative DNA helicase
MPNPPDRRSSSKGPRVLPMSVSSVPSCPVSEARVLGSILVEPKVGDFVFSTLTPEDFLSPTNSRIFETLEEIYREKKNFDDQEVIDRARENSVDLDLDQIHVLLDGVVVASLDHHVRKVHDSAVRRRVLLAGRDAIEAVEGDLSATGGEIAERATQSLLELAQAEAEDALDTEEDVTP